jgi:hypothetical protein
VEDVRAAIKKITTKDATGGREKCVAVLQTFGAASASALKAEHYADAIAKLNEL